MKGYLASVLVLLPFAAFGDEAGQLVPRDQCQPLYTVQKRGCVAEHVLRCDTPEGTIYRSEFVEDGVLTDVEFADADFEFLANCNSEGENFLLGLVDNRDPFSLSSLLSTGSDTVDQTALVDPQFVAPREAEIVGISRMTGDARQVGESEVERIAFEGTAAGTGYPLFDTDRLLEQVAGLLQGGAEVGGHRDTQGFPGAARAGNHQ